MSIKILKHITVTCDICKRFVTEFDVFLCNEFENSEEVRCQSCSEEIKNKDNSNAI